MLGISPPSRVVKRPSVRVRRADIQLRYVAHLLYSIPSAYAHVLLSMRFVSRSCEHVNFRSLPDGVCSILLFGWTLTIRCVSWCCAMLCVVPWCKMHGGVCFTVSSCVNVRAASGVHFGCECVNQDEYQLPQCELYLRSVRVRLLCWSCVRVCSSPRCG